MSATSLTAQRIPAGVDSVDPAHSRIAFGVKHMGIATVTSLVEHHRQLALA